MFLRERFFVQLHVQKSSEAFLSGLPFHGALKGPVIHYTQQGLKW